MGESAAGIMSAPQTSTVDVRDMLCAQALAVVARALERLAPGGMLRVTYNADDVRRDLLLWVRERGATLVDAGATAMRIRRSRP